MSKGRNKGSSRKIRRELEVVQVLFQVAKKRRIKKEKEAKKQKKSVIEGLEEVTMQSFIELALSHEQLRERRKMEKKLQKLAKTMDYMERAKREETTPLIEAAFQQRLVEEKVLHEREQQQEVELSRQRHTRDFQEKNRLVRMMDNKMIFQERVMNKEREERISQLIAIRSRERETKRKMIFYLRSVEERLKKLHEDEEARKHEEAERQKREVAEYKAKLDEICRRQWQRERKLEEEERLRKEDLLRRSAEVPPRPAGACLPELVSTVASTGRRKYAPGFRRESSCCGRTSRT